jgi:hypothetical protein
VGTSEAGERAVSDAPHRAQNRLSPGLSAEQRLHFTMDGFTLPLWPRASAGGGGLVRAQIFTDWLPLARQVALGYTERTFDLSIVTS